MTTQLKVSILGDGAAKSRGDAHALVSKLFQHPSAVSHREFLDQHRLQKIYSNNFVAKAEEKLIKKN